MKVLLWELKVIRSAFGFLLFSVRDVILFIIYVISLKADAAFEFKVHIFFYHLHKL